MINLFLSLLVIFLLLVGFSFIFSFVFGAPPVPSTKDARKVIGDVIEKNDFNGKNIVDIGSGFGHMVFYMAKRFPEKTVIGCEISPIPFICSKIWSQLRGYKNTDFRFGNGFTMMEKGEIKTSAAVFYLCPALVEKADKVLPLIEKLLVVNNFPLPNEQEQERIYVGEWAKSTIYVYDCPRSTKNLPSDKN